MSLERVLVVDDEPPVQRALEDLLKRRRITVTLANSLAVAETALARETFDLVMLDVRLPDGDGLVLLERIMAMPAHPLVVVVTGHGSIEHAVNCMRAGAFDYLIKPFRPAQIDIVLKKADNYQQLVKVNRYLSDAANDDGDVLLGRSSAMQRTRQMIERVAPTDATVLITGENGSGKEMVAREVYRNSPRRKEPYIKVNCAALSEQLIESELFGHERGAFTGATERREGRFELANHGTLLLDEVSEIPLNLQAKLLRVLQERELERVGGTKTIKVNVRILATSNRNLQQFVERGLFRSDLYYRLNVFPVNVPPLRERPEDIELFADAFLRRFARKHGLKLPGFTDHALAALRGYPWPGNVRELQNTIERAVILSENGRPVSAAVLNLPALMSFALGQQVAHAGMPPPPAAPGYPMQPAAYPTGYPAPADPFPPFAPPQATPGYPSSAPGGPATTLPFLPPPAAPAPVATPPADEPMPVLTGPEDTDESMRSMTRDATESGSTVLPLSEMEKRAIRDALVATGGNRTQAAELLGISIRTLRNKLKEYRESGEAFAAGQD
jgi:two-component system, NtrC family, response regulator AtoC